jgi:hypothetical protein
MSDSLQTNKLIHVFEDSLQLYVGSIPDTLETSTHSRSSRIPHSNTALNMVTLIQLPTELLRLILHHLADIDLCAIFTARRTCRTIQANVTDIIDKTLSKHGLIIHDFLMAQFSLLIDSSTHGYVRYRYPHDVLAPLRDLPWALDSKIRNMYLRPNTSWQRIPLCSPSGTVIHRLQVVAIEKQHYREKIYDVDGFDVIFYPGKDNHNEIWHQAPGGMTIAEYYDVVTGMTHSRLSGGWRLLFGTRIRNMEEFYEMGKDVQCKRRVITDAEIKTFLEEDALSATLFVGIGEDLWHPYPFDPDSSTLCYPFPRPQSRYYSESL